MYDLAMSSMSICLSICLSHSGIESKLMIVGSCGFDHLIAQGHFFETKFHTPGLRRTPVVRVSKETGVDGMAKNTDFLPVNRYVWK